MDNIYFCKDCKHMNFDFDYICKHPSQERDMVTGAIIKASCYSCRTIESRCGKKAKWFEPTIISQLNAQLLVEANK